MRGGEARNLGDPQLVLLAQHLGHGRRLPSDIGI